MELKDIIKDIEDEPELPGDMPPEMAKAISNAIKLEDINFFVHAMRLAVKMTKQGIAERIRNRHLTNAMHSDGEKLCRCHGFYKGQNSYKFCPDCGRNLRRR